MDYRYSFEVDMDPIPKGRPRFTSRGFAYTPSRTRDAETLMQLRFSEQMIEEPLTGPLKAIVHVYLERPRSHYTPTGKLKKSAPSYPINKRSGDLDNFVKGILDSANGIVFDDDCQILDLNCSKRYADDCTPRVIMLIEPLDDKA